MVKLKVCVDFDGVLNNYKEYDETDLGEPRLNVQEFIKELQKEYEVIILTARNTQRVKKWLKHNNLPDLTVTNQKIPAAAYIDDRAIRFNGDYDAVLCELKDFKPYWDKTEDVIYD